MKISKQLKLLIGFSALGTPSIVFAQSDLATQRYECDRLRERVSRTRQALNAKSNQADFSRQQEDSTIAQMRARGRTEADVQRYLQLNRNIRNMGGSEEFARREHETAIENYQMQGCSTGGQSNYNYNADY